jgi:nucleotide-binding universal stress UspA family protein
MKGEAGSPNEIIGSIANKVIRNTDMPVLAIPEDTKYKSIDQIKNILYATDLDKSDFISIKKLLGIVAYLYPKIYCVHLSESKDDPWSKAKLQSLNEHILKRYPQYKVECTLIECKDKEEGIEDFVKKNDIGLIAINSHKRNIFRRLFNPSFTKKMVFHTNTPLLVFHA